VTRRRDAVAGDDQRTLTPQRPCRPALRGSPHEFLYFPSCIIVLLCICKKSRCMSYMSCCIAEQLMCRADVPNSTLALNIMMMMMMMTVYFPLFHANTRGGNRLTRDTICTTYTRRCSVSVLWSSPARHLLNYPCLRCLHCLRCLLLLVGPLCTITPEVINTNHLTTRFVMIYANILSVHDISVL